jgi:pyruvate,orthophosphate dikinase
MAPYLELGLLKRNPFEVVDADGVGQLVKMAVAAGRATKPGLKTGVCGEHGGDPQSIATFYEAGVDYVSCSPFRVPVARLAAAQAVLASKAKLPAKASAKKSTKAAAAKRSRAKSTKR